MVESVFIYLFIYLFVGEVEERGYVPVAGVFNLVVVVQRDTHILEDSIVVIFIGVVVIGKGHGHDCRGCLYSRLLLDPFWFSWKKYETHIMSGHRWNNRFNPPLETASVRFPRAPIETPQVPANYTTHQMPGAPTPILYTNQITQIPNLSLSFVTSNATELTVTLDVSFDYRMKGTDHYEFTFTNSNTGISTTKSYQQSGNVYTIGEFDPGTNYFVYVTPVINGLFTPSSATTTFLSSPATAPGLIQGAVLTGSGSFAVIKFAGVYPSSPFPNQIAVNDNFGNPQVLVNVTSALKTIVIGPYTDGSSYQYQITPVTVLGGIYRYGTPTGIPTNYFIPGPPGTPQVTAISADSTTVSFSVCADTAFHPTPDYYQIAMCESTLTPITTITGLSGQINDLSTTYASFSISGLSPSLFFTLSAGVGSCNLMADITNAAGLWYSFRVTNMSVSGGNTYFTNPYISKTVLTGPSFTVNFNTLGITKVISTVSALATVSSSVVVDGVTTTFDPSGTIFTVSPVQTDTFTTFVTQTFANKVFSVGSDYGTIFAGPPFLPGYGSGPEIGNQTFRWTVERASGPRPIYYTFFGTGITTISTTTLTGTVSGLTNGTNYQLLVNGFANNVVGNSTIADNLRPAFARPVSLAVTNITSNTVTLSIGRPLGGSQFGYIITATGTGGSTTTVADSSASFISSVISGLQSVSYQFIAYTQTSGTPSANNLSAAAPGIYYLGPPFQPSNVKGSYLGSVSGDITTVNLTLTASRGLVSGFGPTVAQYNISDNFGNLYTAPAFPPNYDLQFTFPNLSAYVSYTFTITPFGNNVSGTAVISPTFDFNPQPPTSPNLFMTGNNGGTMNITFTGTTFPSSTSDYYTISALQAPFVGGGTRVDVPGSPVSYPAEGFAYKFAIYKTICGVTSSTFVQTPQVTGGPPIAPFIGYTLGSNSIVFSLSVSPQSAIVISNFRITEYNKNTVNGSFQATGGIYVVPANTPGLSPSATRTISGLFTASYALVVPGANFQWREFNQTTPQFSLISGTDDTLALNTYPNLVTLRLTQSTSSLTFPVTTFSTFPPTIDYGTTLTTKPTTVFDAAQSLTFTWCSGVGPFTGGTYRYDIQSLGGDTLTSASASVIIDLYVAAPGTPSVVTNNASATVTFAAPPATSVPPQYYEVTDNYGRTISGTTTLSSFVFGQCVTGSAYSFFATSFAQGISSAPSQLSPVVFPGRPNPPNFVPLFGSNSTQKAFATLSTALSSISYIPVTDVFLNVSGTAGYTSTKTNTQTPYTNTTGGPTYTLTNLSLGTSYTFTICALANQVYSTTTTYNYYVGSLTPNGQPTIVLSNTTAYVSVSAAVPASKLGGVNPDTYVFLFSGPNTGSVTIPYNSISSTYTGVLPGLTALSNYTFSGHTITNGISYGGAWSDLRTFNAGGPRPSVSPHITYSVLGNPLTQTVSLQVVIFTGCGGATGLWADTSYYINVSSAVTPVPAPVTFSTPGLFQFTTIGAGNVDVIIAGAGGGAGRGAIAQTTGGFFGGAGGLVTYTFPNVPAGTVIIYNVGLGGQHGYSFAAAEGGGSSYVRIGNVEVTAGGGAGGAGDAGNGIAGGNGGGPYGGVGGSGPGADGSGGPVGIVTTGGGGIGGITPTGEPSSYGGNGYIRISAPGYTFSTMTVSSFVVPVKTGNTYYASVYAVKNQVTGSLFPTSGFVVPPAPPLNPTITLAPTPNINILDPRGTSEQVVYVTAPQGSQPNSPYTTTKYGNYTVTVAGAGGGAGGSETGKAGGLVTYTFSNIDVDTPIYYIVGAGGGAPSGDGGGGGGAGSAVSIYDLSVFAGGGGGGRSVTGGTGGGSGVPWGSSTDPNLLYNLTGVAGSTFSGGHGGGNNVNQDGGGTGGTATTAATPGSGDGPAGRVVTTGGGSAAGQSGFVRIVYTLSPSHIPATIAWGQSATSDVSYYYSVNGGTYVNNSTLTTGQISLDYGSTSKIRVYSFINGVSSTAIESASAYVFTNPPTTLTYGRTLTSVTLSWASAFQPAYPSNTVYTVSSTSSTTASGVTITSAGGGPSITIGINIMSSTTYSTITTAVALGHPIVITLSSIGSTVYRQSLPILTYSPPTPGIPGYKFTNSTIAGLPSYVGNAVMFITNPSALPTNGYTLSDLCSGVVIASNIYQNTYTWTGATLGSNYNLAVQALNSNLYSGRSNAITGLFRLSTIAVSTLSATYTGGDVTLSWKTPQQFDGITPTATPPYTWTIVDQSGNVTATSAGTPARQSVTGLFPGLGGTFTYSIITNYYGVSSSPTTANQISLKTTPPPTVTQTTIGPGILVTWTAALQSVYLPTNPTVLSNIPPNGGYKIVDLCGKYTGALTAGPTDTQIFVQIAEANLYNYYNFAVSASHNGIMSISTAPGPIFLGVDPVTNPSVTLDGMIATLTWNAPVSNGPNAPYRIFDSNGFPLGDKSRLTNQTVIFSNPGVYSITTLATETIVANACGAGGSVAAGGFISNVYPVTPGTTIVVTVGAAGAGGGNSTVHVPNPGNPYLILDAGGGGGFTVSGEGFIRNGFPDGGGIQLPGSGSAGGEAQPIVGGGSAPSTDGRVQLTLTTASLASSIYTSATSISFTIANYTTYNLQIESSSNGLTRTASLTLNTTVRPPTLLRTTFRGFILSNAWTPATGVPEYFITNLTTGDYNSNVFGSPSPFSVPGILNTTYRFSIYSVSGDIPSSQITSVSPVTLFCPIPTNFRSTYLGTTISFSVSANTAADSQTFTLTDGSGTILQSNIPNFNTGRGPPITPVFGNIAGRTYTFNIFGVLSGLCSEPATTSISLTIPGSIRLGLPPYILNVSSAAETGSNNLYIYECTPARDTWSIVPTFLETTYNSYQGVPGQQYWLSAAMGSNGCNVIAANNITTTGSNLWVSGNGGLNWTSAGNTASRIGAYAQSTAIALNGTTGALTTNVGLFMSSNVSGNATWVPVNTPVIGGAVAISPDGYRIIIAPFETTGTLYYATMDGFPTLSFFGANGPIGFSANFWSLNSLKWSGDGTTIIAAGGFNPKGVIYRSTDNGQTFSRLPTVSYFPPSERGNPTPAQAYTSISINSNATIILAGFNPATTPAANQQVLYTYKTGQVGFETSWLELPVGIVTVGTSTGQWRCTQSYFGDVMIVCDTGSSKVYVSYDSGFSWYKESRYVGTGFAACAISSNGLSEVLMGDQTYLQTIIATPQPSTTTILRTSGDGPNGSYRVPAGADGYTITPLLKNIPGPQQFVWVTPQAGPDVFPQPTGLASFVVPYASGYSLAQNYYWGYYVIDKSANWVTTTTQILTKPAGYTDSPVLSVYTPTPAFPATKSCLRIASPGLTSDLIPGTYIINVNVLGGQVTTAAVTIPLRPPPAPTLIGQGGSTIQAKWTPTVGVAYTTVTYNIYSNGNLYCNTTGGTATEKFADIPNTGIIPTTIGIEALVGGITSARVSTSISPPLPPTGLLVTGYATSTSINLSWNVVSGHSYTLSYGGTTYPNLGQANIPYTINLAQGSAIVIGLASLSTNLLSTYSIVTATNRVTGFNAPGLTVTRNIPSQFVITAMSIIGAGGGGGGGGYAIGFNTNGQQGGGGGAQGGNLLFTGGTGPVQQASSTITLYPGKAGAGGLYGGGGQGGQTSSVQITTGTTVKTIAWAGGGGGGGGGNGGPGAAGGRLATNESYGNGGTGGTTGNVNGGGGGNGGWGSSFATTDPNITPLPSANYSTITGSNGDSRQGTANNATTGGKGGGPGGGAAQATANTAGNPASGVGSYGSGGGGGAPSSSGSSGSTTAPRGGSGADGYISISYCFLTT